MTTLRRRSALSLLSGGLAFLAGCSDTSDGNGSNTTGDGNGTDGAGESTDSIDGTLPSYASILPTTDRSEYFFGAIDVETMSTLLEDQGAQAGAEPTDPLVGNPVVVALLCSFGLTRLGSSAGFDAYNDNNETADGAEQFVYADGVYALVGSYDREGIATDLEDAGYALETDAEGYAVYSDSGSDEVVGIADDVYAYSYPNDGDSSADPVTSVERTVATAAGRREPNHEVDDDFDRLLRRGENDGITCCLYTDADQFDSETLSDDQASDEDSLQFEFAPFEGASGVHQQLSVPGDGSATARAVVSYGSDDLVDEERLESALGTEAEAVEFGTDGSTVEIDAEYGGEFARE
ncbi:hypothetical protein [Natrinema ejinorense]|uniref:Uncharacterized protein n=1 Tax=Natrinema ejinorense TaxID=373386 RepID=A0A2A5QTL9_9EURY|nr:hypothetical protein [Natrinema ejinorense]PCR90181.1 hypothetical protein CP557_06270 [Natrinema ejinorense]